MTSTEPVEFTNRGAEIPLLPLPRAPLSLLVGECYYCRILLARTPQPEGSGEIELRWSSIDVAADDVDDVHDWEIVHVMAPEAADDDDEGFFSLLTEYAQPFALSEAIELWELITDWRGNVDVLQAIVSDGSSTLGYWNELSSMVTEQFQGVHQSRESFAEQYASDVVDYAASTSWPFNHIDWESAAHDLFSSGYLAIDHAGDVYVFSEH